MNHRLQISRLYLAVIVATSVSFGQVDASGRDTIYAPPEEPKLEECTVTTYDDTTVILHCPNSTDMRLKVRNQRPRREFGIDPSLTKVFLGQTAFVRKGMPFSLSLTEGVFISAEAVVTPSTVVSFDFIFPMIQNARVYTFGLFQQIYSKKGDTLAIACAANFTHPDTWIWEQDHQLFGVNAKVLCSYRLFERGYVHAGLSYTFQKWYSTDIDYSNGVRYETHKGYNRHRLGLSCAVDWQPFRYAKFIAEYSEDYGFLLGDFSPKSYLFVFGSRVFYRRIATDFAIIPGPFGDSVKFLPFLRFSVFIG